MEIGRTNCASNGAGCCASTQSCASVCGVHRRRLSVTTAIPGWSQWHGGLI